MQERPSLRRKCLSSEGGVGASHLGEEVRPGRRDSECKDVVQVRAQHV